MSEENPNTGVALEATLPLVWTVAGETSPAQTELHTQSNIALLRALAAIDVVAPEHDTHSEPTQKALERMEAKLDVVMLMVAILGFPK